MSCLTILKIYNLDPSVIMSNLKWRVMIANSSSLEKRYPRDFVEILARIKKYVNIEEAYERHEGLSESKSIEQKKIGQGKRNVW